MSEDNIGSVKFDPSRYTTMISFCRDIPTEILALKGISDLITLIHTCLTTKLEAAVPLLMLADEAQEHGRMLTGETTGYIRRKDLIETNSKYQTYLLERLLIKCQPDTLRARIEQRVNDIYPGEYPGDIITISRLLAPCEACDNRPDTEDCEACENYRINFDKLETMAKTVDPKRYVTLRDSWSNWHANT